MDYTRNEDYYPRDQAICGAKFNAVIDIQFVEGSSPPTEPVTVAEAKQQAIIDDSIMDDTLIESYITTARIQLETFTGLSFLQREIIAIVNNSLGGIYLPYGPIANVLSIFDENDVEITSDSYKVLGIQFKQLKYPIRNYLKITYNAGYETLPQVFKTAILQQVAYLYENRGDVEVVANNYSQENRNTGYNLSQIAKQLVKPYVRRST